MKNTTEFIRRFGPWLILVPQVSVSFIPVLAAGAAACVISDICEKVQGKN